MGRRHRGPPPLLPAGATAFLAAALVAMLAAPVAAGSPAADVLATGLPSHALTPGATNPAVRQATIRRTICVPDWTATVRPSSSYTDALKTRQIRAYGYADRSSGHYEEDHLISLELGGSPASAANLWPEPHHLRLADGSDAGSYAKDAFENYLHRQVCAGRLSLASAQLRISSNWVLYWRRWRASTR